MEEGRRSQELGFSLSFSPLLNFLHCYVCYVDPEPRIMNVGIYGIHAKVWDMPEFGMIRHQKLRFRPFLAWAKRSRRGSNLQISLAIRRNLATATQYDGWACPLRYHLNLYSLST